MSERQRAAAVHFTPAWGQVEANRATLVRLAREADPGLELFLNEAPGLADSSTKARAFYELARTLVEAGVPLDGVGL